MARHSEFRSLLAAVTNAGWRIRRVRHGVLCLPHNRNLAPVWLAGTPGDVRACRNARAALRRAGLQV